MIWRTLVAFLCVQVGFAEPVGIAHSPLAAIPGFRTENCEPVKKSATVGLLVDGVATSSGLEAQKVLDQPLQTVHIDKHNAFSLPLADALALCAASSEFVVLKRQAFDAMRAKGMSSQQAMQKLNEPEVKESLEKVAEKKEKQQERAIKLSENFKEAEAALEAELVPVSSANPLDPDQVDLRYKILLDYEDQEREAFMNSAIKEAKDELSSADAYELAHPQEKIAAEALRVASTEKLQSAFSAFAWAEFDNDREKLALDVEAARVGATFAADAALETAKDTAMPWRPFNRARQAIAEACKSYEKGEVFKLEPYGKPLSKGIWTLSQQFPLSAA